MNKRGQTGRPGRVIHIDPTTVGPMEPPKVVSAAYEAYLIGRRTAGKRAVPYLNWLKYQREKRRIAKQNARPEALKQHQQRPYQA